jgi:hypothetical protein
VIGQEVDLHSGAVEFAGAVSLEWDSQGVRPWRLPHGERELFSPEVINRAGQPAGVRLCFQSDTRNVGIELAPLEGDENSGTPWTWDLLVDGELSCRVTQPCEKTEITFASQQPTSQAQARRLEIFFPSQYLPVRLRRLCIDSGSSLLSWHDERLRFLMYGSSITQASAAAGPSETWSAIVAAAHDLHLINLGFGGQEHAEAGIARVIRAARADVIGLCLGGNIHATSSLSQRTYLPAVIDMVRIIREQHASTPIALSSCIHLPAAVAKANALGHTLDAYRLWTREAVEKLRGHGDGNLFYVHGPDLYGPPDAAKHTHDGAHPDSAGQRLLGERFAQEVMPRLLALR